MTSPPMAASQEGAKKTAFRRDIQGLRAVAVIAVILNHAVGKPSGGFLGVDIFFVISGFIITALLLREVDRTGRISFVQFYKRRVKRILPAATLVLAVTVALSVVIHGGERARQIAGDALAATFFVSNWRFAATGADYWADDGTTSPLQHYWSLGVEEQFYVVWPILIGVVALILHQRRALKPVLGVILTLIVIGSLAWAAHETDTAPMWAYFSTLTRAWELGAGALLAVSANSLTRIPERVRPYLAWSGIAALAYSLLTVTEADGMPVPGAVLAVAATVLIIGAGTGAVSEAAVWPLSNRGSSYIGDISYSLYLWHLPVIVFIGPYFAHRERRFLLTVLAITAVLSVASYHLVEDPIRRSRWLETNTGRRSHLYTIATSAVVIGLIATTSVLALRPDITVASAPAAATIAPQSQEELTEHLRLALAADEWPALSPAPGDVAEDGQSDERWQGCDRTDLSDPDSCWFPNDGAGRTALVMGDSTAINLLPTVRAALGEGWNVRGTTMAGCPQLPLHMNFRTEDLADICIPHQAAALELVASMKPDIVFVRNVYTQVNWVSSKVAPEDGGTVEWGLALADLITELEKHATTVVVVQSPPLSAVLSECAAPGSAPAACVSKPDTDYRLVGDAERAVARATGIRYVNTEDWFCVDGACPSFAGNIPLKSDSTHTTKQYAAVLAPVLRDDLSDVLD
ncbi:acyltransferase family protein [Microbacterium sp. A84]|uniref:acyltransferase family protein n=1 Tax=Microbacterium sp. A84 TaxID=3450715 RepID=UPI003F428799